VVDTGEKSLKVVENNQGLFSVATYAVFLVLVIDRGHFQFGKRFEVCSVMAARRPLVICGIANWYFADQKLADHSLGLVGIYCGRVWACIKF